MALEKGGPSKLCPSGQSQTPGILLSLPKAPSAGTAAVAALPILSRSLSSTEGCSGVDILLRQGTL